MLRLAPGSGEPSLVLRESLPGDARSFTPSLERCLEPGASYAWSVASARVDGAASLDWAPAFRFAVAARPGSRSADDAAELDRLGGFLPSVISELERVVETVVARVLRSSSYRGALDDALGAEREVEAAVAARRVTDSPGRSPSDALSASDAADAAHARGDVERHSAPPLTRPDATAPGVARTTSAATAPTLGTPSVKVSANVALGAASNLFKDGDVLLWDDVDGNTALGREALSSVTGDSTHNTALGRGALRSTTWTGGYEWDGSYNTAVGDHALAQNTIGYRNTATGAYALYANTFGIGNTATGYDALRSNTTGTRNTAMGIHALRHTTEAVGNSAFGAGSLQESTDGNSNSAFGADAMRSTTTGDRNTALGFAALYENEVGNWNTAVGALALEDNEASRNTAVGAEALRYSVSGSKNTAVGVFAMRSNVNGNYSAAIGYSALGDNVDGIRNTAAGPFALDSNVDGDYNAALGFRSLRSNTSGNGNTGIGSYTLLNSATGSRNTAIGYRSGLSLTDGSDNVFIHTLGGATDSNVLRIGKATGEGDFELKAAFVQGIRGKTTGVADAVAVMIDSAGQLGTVSSSRHLKRDIEGLGALADRVLDLRPVAFRYREQVAKDPDAPLEFGLIAEEVAEVFPELVVFGEDGRAQTVKYHLLSSLLLGEVQRQHGELIELRARIGALEAEPMRAGRGVASRTPAGVR